MCFEFEIPNKKKDKNFNMIDAEFEVEPELEKVTRTGYCVSKIKQFFFFVVHHIFGLAKVVITLSIHLLTIRSFKKQGHSKQTTPNS